MNRRRFSADEIAVAFQRGLNNTNEQLQKIASVTDHLYRAASLFNEIGRTKEAELVTKILSKIASSKLESIGERAKSEKDEFSKEDIAALFSRYQK